MVAQAERRAAEAEKAAKEAVAKIKDQQTRKDTNQALTDGKQKLDALMKKVLDKKEITAEDEEALKNLLTQKEDQFRDSMEAQKKKIEEAMKGCTQDIKKRVGEVFARGRSDLSRGTFSIQGSAISDALGQSLDACKDGLRDMMEDYTSSDMARQAFQAQAMAMATALMAVNPMAAMALLALVMLMNSEGGGGGGKGSPGRTVESTLATTTGINEGVVAGPKPPALVGGPVGQPGIPGMEGTGCRQMPQGDTLILMKVSDPNVSMKFEWSRIDWTSSNVQPHPSSYADSGITKAVCNFDERRLELMYGGICILVSAPYIETAEGKDQGTQVPAKASMAAVGAGC